MLVIERGPSGPVLGGHGGELLCPGVALTTVVVNDVLELPAGDMWLTVCASMVYV